LVRDQGCLKKGKKKFSNLLKSRTGKEQKKREAHKPPTLIPLKLCVGGRDAKKKGSQRGGQAATTGPGEKTVRMATENAEPYHLYSWYGKRE